MKSIFRISCMIVCAGLAACSTANLDKSPDLATTGSQKETPVAAPPFPKIDLWLADNRLVINAGQARVFEYDKAFAQGTVLAYGEGYPVAGAEGGQKRLTAITAAKVVAQRNLTEYFTRYATNGEIRFNTYSARLEAFLKGAQVVASEYNPDMGKAAVLLKLDLGGAKGFAR